MPLKILVWNLQDFFLFLDKYTNENLKELSEPQWQLLSSSLKPLKPLQKIFDISHVIQKSQADLCLFTEVGGFESLDNFNRLFLNNKYKPIHYNSNSDRGIDLGALVNPSLQIDSKFHSHKDFARGVLELSFSYQGHYLHFLLTHLKSKLYRPGEDFEGRTQRDKEVDQLIKIATKILQSKQHFPLICGDLNGIIYEQDTEPELSKLQQKLDVKDVLNWLEKPLLERSTYFYFTKMNSLTPMQLDYCLIPKKLKSYISKKSSILDFSGSYRSHYPTKKNFDEPSDHYPLFIELDFS
ncbi:MAG: hypothetical protein QF441_10980 [Bacteriovoracaceae bacterium]|jgi:endonuclease/exonuclease/phosphatase family metal-dependent hydrolase|nr:hypothetical protein [Bacteriovoracaceae bacterium]|tara:strand:+ start:502 stop:1389 length:888 start_codon:yes stop_codon:yes gene_type:complete